MKLNFKVKMKKLFLFILINVGLGLGACEDPVPDDYIQENIVQAVLMVNEPITGILIMSSQPVLDSFSLEKSMIRDAEVTIKGDGEEIVLVCDDNGVEGYYDPLGEYLIKPETQYDLEIILNDGTVMTGTTTTPQDFDWISPERDFIQFPFDTVNYPATDTIAWGGETRAPFYILAVKNLDTLEYGKYLDPSTDEKNRRVIIGRSNNDDRFREYTTWAFIANTKTSVVWRTFKWYGMHEVAVYNPDNNYFRWFFQNYLREYDYKLNSIENGVGVFGSSSVIRDTFMLLKNQP